MLDTLALARRLHPGQRNSLDALAKRYSVDNSKRELHGALLDAQILADIYLAMTGGQVSLSLDSEEPRAAAIASVDARVDRSGLELVVVRATAEEEAAHEALLAVIAKRGAADLAASSSGAEAAGALRPQAAVARSVRRARYEPRRFQ